MERLAATEYRQSAVRQMYCTGRELRRTIEASETNREVGAESCGQGGMCNNDKSIVSSVRALSLLNRCLSTISLVSSG